MKRAQHLFRGILILLFFTNFMVINGATFLKADSKGIQLKGEKAAAIKLTSPKSKNALNDHQGENIRDILRLAGKRAMGGGLPGLLGGLVQVTLLMWLRTICNYQYRYGVTLAQAWKTLYEEGGIGRLYKGVFFAAIQAPLTRFGSTAANEAVMTILANTPAAYQLPLPIINLVDATIAGLWRLFLSPIDTCKVVLQVEGSAGFKGLMERVWGGEVMALYQGCVAAALTTMVGHYPFFLCFTYLSRMIPKPKDSMKRQVLRNAFIGFVSSVFSDLFSSGFRVVKATKQATAAFGAQSYIEVINSIMQDRGWLGFFRGLETRIFANGLQSILFTVVWRLLYEEVFLKTGSRTVSKDKSIKSFEKIL